MFDSIKITMKTSLILTFLFLSTTNAQDQKKQNLTELNYPEVSLISTEKRMLYSKIVEQDFEIYISLPYKYFMSDTTYPVLYSLDANVKFGMMSNVVNNLGTLTRDIPEIIVVGIAYPIKV